MVWEWEEEEEESRHPNGNAKVSLFNPFLPTWGRGSGNGSGSQDIPMASKKFLNQKKSVYKQR